MALQDPNDPFYVTPYASPWDGFDEAGFQESMAVTQPMPMPGAPPMSDPPEYGRPKDRLGPGKIGQTDASVVDELAAPVPPTVTLPWEPVTTLPSLAGQPQPQPGGQVQNGADFVVPASDEQIGADAISGGATPAQQADIDKAKVTGSPVGGWRDVDPAEMADMSPEDVAEAVSRQSPEDQIRWVSQRQAAINEFANKRIAEEQEKNRLAAEANNRAREEAMAKAQQKSEEIEADAKRLRDDPLHDVGFGAKLAGVAAAFIGGFAMNKTGRNVGLEGVKDLIEREIDLQTQDLARRKGALADEYARHGDLFRAREASRLAKYDQAIQVLGAEIQKFDPRGTQAMKLIPQYQQLQADRARAAQSMHAANVKTAQQGFENQLKFNEDRRKEEDHADKRAAAAAKLAGAGGVSASNRELTPQEFATKYDGLVEPELLPKSNMTEKSFQQMLETTNKGREASNKIAARRVPGVMPDGSDFIATAGTDPRVGEVNTQMAAFKGMVRLLDDARRIRTGWSSDLGKNKEWQDLKTIWGSLQGKGKAALGLGALSESDFKLLGEYLGTDDPTKARGVDDAVNRARKNILADANDALASIGYKGRFDIKDLQANSAQSSNADDELALVLERAGKANATEEGGEIMSPHQAALISKWEGQAANGDKRSLDNLEKAANKAKVNPTRAAAAAALQRLAAPNLPVVEEAE